ncbi:MAG: peptidoglycan D,D-transpeptidase FtsI family protein, partial [Solirubrobacteraceae bacterium]
MIDELEVLQADRPDVRPPTEAAAREARRRLEVAIEHETLGPLRPRARRSSLGWMTAALGVLVTVIVAGGAIVLLGHGHHHHSAASATGRSAGHRGEILASDGRALARTRPRVDVVISLSQLPASANQLTILYRRLAGALHVSDSPARCTIAGRDAGILPALRCVVVRARASGARRVTIARGVSPDVIRQLGDLPGVTTARVLAREYPLRGLAAQTIGTTGLDSADHATAGVLAGTSGLEAQYNSYLAAGDSVRTSLDVRLQQIGQQALVHSMALNHAPGGAFVAMNPDNGQVYAIGSEPSFDPGVLTAGESAYNRLTAPSSGDPLLNRAIQSAGPTGSTFKAITATAALSSGAWSPGETFDDTGHFCVGTSATTQCRRNPGNAVYGVLDLQTALKVSSDDFFFHLGALLNKNPVVYPSGGPLQQWAARFGIGRPTGIDLPGEVAGTLPSPRWRQQRNQLEQECDTATGPFRYTNPSGTRTGPTRLPGWRRSSRHAPGGCGIADGTGRPWSIGDAESLAVGQGDVQVTPMQLAVAYAALANGRDVPTPHIGLDVQSQTGIVLRAIEPPPARSINLNPAFRQEILAGLREAGSKPGGSSDDVFASLAAPVYGDTGTAPYSSTKGVERRYAWYAGFVPSSATSRPI